MASNTASAPAQPTPQPSPAQGQAQPTPGHEHDTGQGASQGQGQTASQGQRQGQAGAGLGQGLGQGQWWQQRECPSLDNITDADLAKGYRATVWQAQQWIERAMASLRIRKASDVRILVDCVTTLGRLAGAAPSQLAGLNETRPGDRNFKQAAHALKILGARTVGREINPLSSTSLAKRVKSLTKPTADSADA